MNHCKRFKLLISDYLEGFLQGIQKKEVEEHLKVCRSCYNDYQGLKSIKMSLRRLPPKKTSPDFETILRTRISMERVWSRRGFIQGPLRIPMYTAATLVIVFAAFFIYYSLKISESPSTTLPAVTVQNSSNHFNQTIQPNPQESVFYSMEEVTIPSKGTPINSETLQNAPSKADSIARNHRVPVSRTLEF